MKRDTYSMLTIAQKKIVQIYASLAQANSKLPTRTDLKKKGVSRDMVRSHFGNLEGLEGLARKTFPDHFKSVIDDTRFNTEVFDEMAAVIKGYSRFVITTAVAGCPVHKGFYASLKQYCKKNEALLLILPSDNQLTELAPDLVENEHIVFDMIRLNQNIELSNIKIQAKMIDPLTGLSRFAQRRSFIFASPKQRLQPVAVSNKNMPHVMMTTGAITLPRYHGAKYIQHRTDYIATADHTIGAIVVEVKDSKEYYFRQIQAEPNGSFIDLDKHYSTDGVKKAPRALAVVYGDWHSGVTDALAKQGGAELCALVRPEHLVIHDGFDGRSINHHEIKKKATRARRAAEQRDSLATELLGLKMDLDGHLSPLADRIVFVKSNHDEVIARWLEDASHVNDPKNAALGSKLFAAMVEGHDPLQYALEQLLALECKDKMVWLSRDEDFKLAGIELGAHGDLGPNGATGSLKATEAAYGSSVSGHAHWAAILRNAWQVGTKSKLKQGYNVGPSSWTHTDCIVHANGTRQLINYINGRWKL